MSDEWNDDYQPEGITMGPEERLEREIAKSKALKVERLQLRDRIARLEEEVTALGLENKELARKLAQQQTEALIPEKKGITEPASCEAEATGASCWVQGAVVIGLIASMLLGIRLYFG